MRGINSTSTHELDWIPQNGVVCEAVVKTSRIYSRTRDAESLLSDSQVEEWYLLTSSDIFTAFHSGLAEGERVAFYVVEIE